jgi:hypothetical protein
MPGVRHMASAGEAGDMPRGVGQRIDESDELVRQVRRHRNRSRLGLDRHQVAGTLYSHRTMIAAMMTAQMVMMNGAAMMGKMLVMPMVVTVRARLRGAGKKAKQ